MGNILNFPPMRKTEVEYDKTVETFIEETKAFIGEIDSSFFGSLLAYWFKHVLVTDVRDLTKVFWWWSLYFGYDGFYSLETHQYTIEGEIGDWTREDGHETRGVVSFCRYQYTWVNMSYETDWSIQKTVQSALKNWIELIKRRLGSADRTGEVIRHMVYILTTQGWVVTDTVFPNTQEVLNGDFIRPVILVFRNRDFQLTLEFDYFNYRGHWVEHPDCILE